VQGCTACNPLTSRNAVEVARQPKPSIYVGWHVLESSPRTNVALTCKDLEYALGDNGVSHCFGVWAGRPGWNGVVHDRAGGTASTTQTDVIAEPELTAI
jgi:hypothetical protein